MLVTSLGHAGFLLESPETVVVCDPWLSGGAFRASWFPWPRNEHVRPIVERALDDDRHAVVYVSHHHADHLDPGTLRWIAQRRPTVVVPGFRRNPTEEAIRSLGFDDVRVVADGEGLDLPDGRIELLVDDSGLNRDSAALVRLGGVSFLDFNDCKLFDRLLDQRPALDVFACQYSGASWHPTCYEYEPEHRAAVVAQKRSRKVETLQRVLEVLRPPAFVPSAGPPVFLDPRLRHLNHDADTIFPRSETFVRELDAAGLPAGTAVVRLEPGVAWTPGTAAPPYRTPESGPAFDAVIDEYAADHAVELAAALDNEPPADELVEPLGKALAAKGEALAGVGLDAGRLAIGIDGWDGVYEVDLATGSVEAGPLPPRAPYVVVLSPGDLGQVVAGAMSWEDLSATFRTRLRRTPDRYSSVVDAFLKLDGDDLRAFVDDEVRGQRAERVQVAGAGACWEVDRWCPHQGADLATGSIDDAGVLVCPRHRWAFDLPAGGRCEATGATINAVEVDGAC